MSTNFSAIDNFEVPGRNDCIKSYFEPENVTNDFIRESSEIFTSSASFKFVAVVY